MVNVHRCKNIVTTVNDTVKDSVKSVESVQVGGNIDSSQVIDSTISSIHFDS